MKYLLSDGSSTSRVEYYIIDLFKLYLNIYPKDIPNSPNIGFDFILTDVKKDELVRNVRNRVEILVNKIKDKFTKTLSINIESIEIIDETKVKLVINVNQVQSDDIVVNIDEQNQ